MLSSFHILLKQFLSGLALLGSSPLPHSHISILLLVLKFFLEIDLLNHHPSIGSHFMFGCLFFCFIFMSFMIFSFIEVTFSFISTGLWSDKRGFNSHTVNDLIMSCLSRALVMKPSISYHLFKLGFHHVLLFFWKKKEFTQHSSFPIIHVCEATEKVNKRKTSHILYTNIHQFSRFYYHSNLSTQLYS